MIDTYHFMCLAEGIRLRYAYNMMRHEPQIPNKKLIRTEKVASVFSNTLIAGIQREYKNKIIDTRAKGINKEALAEERRRKQEDEKNRKKQIHRQRLEWMAEKTRIAKEVILKKEAYSLKKLENAGFIKADDNIREEENLESITRYYVVRDGVLVEIGFL